MSARLRFRRPTGFVLAIFVALVSAILVGAGALTARAEDDLAALKAEYRRPEAVPFPEDNPYSPAKAELGRWLFFDPLLSGSRRLSCATCHNPGLSWGDGLAHAHGAGTAPLPLRAPTLLNVAWIDLLGWDGKFPSLE